MMSSNDSTLPLPNLPTDLLRRYFEEEGRLADAVTDAEKTDTAEREGTAPQRGWWPKRTPPPAMDESAGRLGALFREIREKALADPAVTARWREAVRAESLERVKARDPGLFRAMEREGVTDVKALDDLVVKRMLARVRPSPGAEKWPNE